MDGWYGRGAGDQRGRGLTPLAAGNDTIVTRQVAGQPKRYRVSVRRITEGQEPDFTLEAGDIVYVPERIF